MCTHNIYMAGLLSKVKATDSESVSLAEIVGSNPTPAAHVISFHSILIFTGNHA